MSTSSTWPNRYSEFKIYDFEKSISQPTKVKFISLHFITPQELFPHRLVRKKHRFPLIVIFFSNSPITPCCAPELFSHRIINQKSLRSSRFFQRSKNQPRSNEAVSSFVRRGCELLELSQRLGGNEGWDLEDLFYRVIPFSCSLFFGLINGKHILLVDARFYIYGYISIVHSDLSVAMV